MLLEAASKTQGIKNFKTRGIQNFKTQGRPKLARDAAGSDGSNPWPYAAAIAGTRAGRAKEGTRFTAVLAALRPRGYGE